MTGITPPGDSNHAAAENGQPKSQAEKIGAAMAQLSDADRALAITQNTCPVSDALLGTMGPPPKVSVGGRDVFICCNGCREELTSNAEKYLAKLPTPEQKGASDKQ